ncbi:MAG: glutamate racemase [Anaerolineaceae bacterium]|nr:glutamate racemase [Anaerolineaceae bacterium]MBN2677892.1 glutamate racemase [Anaerolineaceae bacterium]
MVVQHEINDPIGIFDSGVGGLSILREIHRLLPSEKLLYVADQAHVPYGSRSLEEVQSYAVGITRFLLDEGVKLIAIACNAASSASLQYLRGVFNDIPFVGMEPALKPASQQTRSQHVGILATQVTFQGALYASLLERFAQNVTIHQSTCPGLVTQIEKGNLDDPETRRILEDAIKPMLMAGIDTIVLGCTHYPFVIPLIKEIAGHRVKVIDPSPAIALQIKRVLKDKGLINTDIQNGSISIFTSASPTTLQSLLPILIGDTMTVQSLFWDIDTHGVSILSRRAKL